VLTCLVWAFYPESNQRTLEEMDMLFSADTPWVWDAEREFKRLKQENPDLVTTGQHIRTDLEAKVMPDQDEAAEVENIHH
jgi:hypothetical protein